MGALGLGDATTTAGQEDETITPGLGEPTITLARGVPKTTRGRGDPPAASCGRGVASRGARARADPTMTRGRIAPTITRGRGDPTTTRDWDGPTITERPGGAGPPRHTGSLRAGSALPTPAIRERRGRRPWTRGEACRPTPFPLRERCNTIPGNSWRRAAPCPAPRGSRACSRPQRGPRQPPSSRLLSSALLSSLLPALCPGSRCPTLHQDRPHPDWNLSRVGSPKSFSPTSPCRGRVILGTPYPTELVMGNR